MRPRFTLIGVYSLAIRWLPSSIYEGLFNPVMARIRRVSVNGIGEFSINKNQLAIGKKYTYIESSRAYKVECLAFWFCGNVLMMKLKVLETSSKPHSAEVGDILTVGTDVDDGGQRIWALRNEGYRLPPPRVPRCQ